MRILVLGGTGAMGKHLVEQLESQDNEVTVTSRSRSGRTGGAEYIKGNAHDLDFLCNLLSKPWDAIVDFMVYTTAEFQQRYKKLLAATDQYFFISSARVYADSKLPLTEDSPRLLDVVKDAEYLKTDEYALSKARQENLLFSSGSSNWTIIRPYITYDSERLQLGVLEKEDWLYRALRGRSVLTARQIQDRTTTLTSGEDVSSALCALIGKQAALGQAFHITSGSVISWREVSEIYSEVLVQHGAKVSLVEQDLDGFLSWRSGKYQVVYDRLFDRVFDNKKISQFVDHAAFIVPQDGLKECLGEFLKKKHYVFKTPNWREEALKDYIVKEKTPLSEVSGLKSKIKYSLFRAAPKAGRLLLP